MKDQATEILQNYVAYHKCQYNLFPKQLHTDNGGEYITGDLQRWCASKGIRLEYTALYSPAQNGIAEWMNCMLAELACAMILSTKTPNFLWPEAITHTAYLHNQTHTWALDAKTPLKAWCGYKPDVSHLQEFGSLVWILTEGQLSKMQPRSIKHTFMGFIDGPKAIKYYDASTWHVRVLHNFQFPAMVTPQTNINNTATPMQNTVQSEGESAPQTHNRTDSEKNTHPCDSIESRKRKRTTDEVPEENNIRKSQRQKNTHDYHLLDNPWVDEPDEMSETANMTSAERVYAMSSEPSITPDNPKTLNEAQ